MWGSSGTSGPSNNSSITSVSGIVSQATVNQRQHTNNSSSKRVYRLLAFTVFCTLLYWVWGPLLIVTCALAVILHLCYSLYVNDSFVTPYTSVLLGHAIVLAIELIQTLQALYGEGLGKSRILLEYLKRRYKERFNRLPKTAAEDDSMNDGKKNLYKRNLVRSKNLADYSNQRNSDLFNSFTLNGINNVMKTSTPMLAGSNFKRTEKQNGGVNIFNPTNNILSKKVSPLRSENKPTLDLSQSEDILYSPKSSSWNHSMSLKIKDKSESLKNIQNIAGPLLNSSRHNMDPKLYTDITSPGLTSRLTKYASEASHTLTHQSQYGTGQFPKVNLNASPIPILSPKIVKSRMPVTVRVAPPEITNYSPVDGSNQHDKSKMYTTDVRESKSCPNVDHVLKKMALKRHASRDEIMMDFKKQKPDQVYEGQLENLEEMMQKRTRDDSTMSDDELSLPSNNQKPAKRSKSSSCHDVINSLSSSATVLSGVKRKASDSSQCNSSEKEKIFKPSSASLSPNRSTPLITLPSKKIMRSKEQLNVKVPMTNTSGEPHQDKVQQKTPETSLPNTISSERKQSLSTDTETLLTPKVSKEISNSSVLKSEKLTDKLFMKPEPQANEKLKSLIQEQAKVNTPFKNDDKDEIKKQDIDNMRQNSMRMRLKNMFDAISGKSASKINPDVVIQAEEVNSPATTTSSYATLNSLTTTTTVNTSPITTTIIPILKSDDTKSHATSKHVTFNLPPASSSSSSSLSIISNSKAQKSTETKTFESSSLGEHGATTTSASSFSFTNKPATSTAVSSSLTNPLSSSGFSFPVNNSVTTTTPSANTSITKSPSTTSTLFSSKSETEALTTSGSSVTTTSGFTFGTTIPKTTTPALSFTPSVTSPSFSFTSPTSSAPSFSFNSNTSTSTSPTFSFNSNKSLTSVGSTESTSTTSTPVLGFGNTLSKSSSSMSFASTSTPSTGSTISTTSIFGGQSSNLSYSMNNITTTSNTTPVTTLTTSTPSMFNFNANNKPVSSGFSFNAPTASTSSTTSASLTFSFRSNAQSNANATDQTSMFAMPASSSTTSTTSPSAFNSTPSLFNAPNNSPSLFSGASTMGSSLMFKGPTATTVPTTSTTSIFGSTSSSFGTAVTTTGPSLFGSNAPVSTNLFGNTASTTISTTPTMSSFGTSVTQPSQQSSIFSGVTVTTSSSIFGASSSSSLFSGTSSSSTNLASTADNTRIFGQSKPTTFGGTTSAFGATSMSSGFSSPSINNPTSNSSTFQIGSTLNTNSLPSFGKSTTTFGAPASTSSSSIFGTTTGDSAFGLTNASTPLAFGSATPSGNLGLIPSGSTFGSAAPSGTFGSGTSAPDGTFGSSTSTPGSAFGSSASPAGSTFGSGTSAPVGAFGSSATAPSSTFGSGSSAFGSGPSTFGNPTGTTSPFGGASTSTQAPSLFGNTPATSSTSSASFSFGGAQSTQQQSQQQSSPFNFGSANNANTAGSGGMFQFGGANTSAKPAGFNFNAPSGAPAINFSGSTAPPAFNAPAPNMFSIGSGSSTPRSRSNRQRRQR